MVVHDRTYTRLQGERRASVPALWTLFDRGVLTSLAVLFRRKVFAVILSLWAFGPFVFAVLLMYGVFFFRSTPELQHIADNLGGLLELVTPTPDTVWGFLMQVQLPVALVFCVLVGAGLIAEDRRTNALELYLSRPLGVFQYVTGKLMVIGFFLAGVTVLPATVIILVWMAMGARDGAELLSLVHLLWRTAAAGLLGVLVLSLLVLTASSLAKRARTAAVLWIGFLVVIEAILTNMLWNALGEPEVRLVSIRFNVGQCMAAILQNPAELDPEVPALHSAVVLAGWIALCSTVLLRRVRPVEIVA